MPTGKPGAVGATVTYSNLQLPTPKTVKLADPHKYWGFQGFQGVRPYPFLRGTVPAFTWDRTHFYVGPYPVLRGVKVECRILLLPAFPLRY